MDHHAQCIHVAAAVAEQDPVSSSDIGQYPTRPREITLTCVRQTLYMGCIFQLIELKTSKIYY